jgi:hypothetical protein
MSKQAKERPPLLGNERRLLRTAVKRRMRELEFWANASHPGNPGVVAKHRKEIVELRTILGKLK